MMRIEQTITFVVDGPVENYDDLRELLYAKFDEAYPGFRDRHGKALDIQRLEFDTEPVTQFGQLRPVAMICRATFSGLLR